MRCDHSQNHSRRIQNPGRPIFVKGHDYGNKANEADLTNQHCQGGQTNAFTLQAPYRMRNERAYTRTMKILSYVHIHLLCSNKMHLFAAWLLEAS